MQIQNCAPATGYLNSKHTYTPYVCAAKLTPYVCAAKLVFYTEVGASNDHIWWWWCYPTLSEGWGRATETILVTETLLKSKDSTDNDNFIKASTLPITVIKSFVYH